MSAVEKTHTYVTEQQILPVERRDGLRGFRIGLVGRVALQALTASLALVFIGSITASFLTVVPLPLIIVSGVVFSILFAIQIIKWVSPYLPESLLPVVHVIRAFAVEMLVTMACTITYPFRQSWFDPTEVDQKKDETPILLIHGYIHNSSAWNYHCYHYRNAGMKSVFTVDLKYFRSIKEYSHAVREKLREVQKITGKSTVKLVGHSMGGLVAAHYATRYAQEDGIDVADLITLGSPLQGTKMAMIGIGKCAEEMRENSSFITNLSQRLKDSKLNSFHLGSKADMVVWPYKTSLNGGDGENNNQHVYKDIGHLSFLYSDRVIQAVTTRLLS